MIRSVQLSCVAATVSIASLLASCAALSHSSGTKTEASSLAGAGPTARPALVAEYDALADSILDARKKEVAIVQKILVATEEDARATYGKAKTAIAKGDTIAATAAIEDLSTLVAQLGTEGDASVARVRKRLIEGGHHFNPILGSAAAGGAHHGDPAHHQGGQDAGHHAQAAPGAPGHAEGATAAPAKPEGQGHHAQGAPGATGQAHHADGAAGAQAKPDGQGHHAQGAAGDPTAHAQNGTHHHAEGVDGSTLGYDPGFVVIPRATKKALLDVSRSISQVALAPAAEPLAAEWAKVEAIWAGVRGGAK